MNTFLVSYDLNQPGQNYNNLYQAIKSHSGYYCNPVESVWIIKSSYSSTDIRDELKQYIDSNDKLIVLRLTGEAAWTGLDNDDAQWLKKHL